MSNSSTIASTDRSADPAARPTALDPVFAQMAGATVGLVRAIGELTEREKTFLCVTADVCQSSFGGVFAAHLRLGLEQGVSTSDIRALLRFISYDSGYHAAAAGFEHLAAYEAEHGITPDEVELLADDLVITGPGAAPSPIPERFRKQLFDLDEHFSEFFDLQSRMRSDHGPDTLSERERALASLSIDVHYQTLDVSFQAHVGRALSVGATRADVRAALRFIALFGATRAWRGWQALNAHFAEVDAADRQL